MGGRDAIPRQPAQGGWTTTGRTLPPAVRQALEGRGDPHTTSMEVTMRADKLQLAVAGPILPSRDSYRLQRVGSSRNNAR